MIRRRFRSTPRLSGNASVAAMLLACVAAAGACRQEQEPVEDRVVVLSPKPAKVLPPKPDPMIWEGPQSDSELEAGRLVWVGTCITCHSTGLGGAPLIGNKVLWSPRLAQGLDTLVEHAIDGFYGDVGEMPARGGNEALSDEEIAAAVRFMASRAGEIE